MHAQILKRHDDDVGLNFWHGIHMCSHSDIKQFCDVFSKIITSHPRIGLLLDDVSVTNEPHEF